MRKVISYLLGAIAVFIFVGILMAVGGVIALLNPPEQRLHRDSLLELHLDGIILNGDKFLEKLRKYREDNEIKGVLVQIDSPGGVVAPSQEIYAEIKRTREEFKKPVVVTALGTMASGAYYAALGADKIIVNSGSMVGSIGVIMEFANLEKLFDWAKIQRYVIKTGKFKDIGAEYRPMSEDERALLQELVNDVLAQFKAAIIDSRKVKPGFLDQYADGRIFTGQMAVKLGLVDEVGTYEDARRQLGELTGLGKDPEMFKPRDHRDFDLRGFFDEESRGPDWKGMVQELLQTELKGRPLLIWPGALGHVW